MLREIAKKNESEVEQTEREQLLLNKEISEIVLREDGKNRCLFNPQDRIFGLSEETLMPSEEEKAKMVQMSVE